MLRRRLLFVAGLVALLVTLVLAASANAAALGPAYFVRATGGAFTVPVHPGGLGVYSSSPAHVVLQTGTALTALEVDAARHNFPWVAILDTRRGRAGMDCFSDGHLVTAKSRVDGFTEGRIAYRGLFLQYRSWHFKAGARKAADCAPSRGGITIAPSIAVSGNSAILHLDCLIRSCKGTLASYGQARLCKRPATVTPGQRGCPPIVTGHFEASGGLTVTFKLPVRGRPLGSILTSITVNGKRGPVLRLGSLPQAYQLPPKQHAATLSVTCPQSTKAGTPVTISGRLSPAGPAVPVTVTFVGGGSVGTQSVTATTDASGAFSAQFTPKTAALWVVDAAFAGDRTRTHAEHGCGFQST